MAAIVVDDLCIDPVQVIVFTADTDLTPVDLGSYSSRVTLMTGNATLEAVRTLKEKLFAAVAEVFQCDPESLTLSEGQVVSMKGKKQEVPFTDAVQWAEAKFGTLGSVGSYTPPRRGGKFKGAGVGPSPNYSYSACVAEVECDQETGIYRVLKLSLAHDVGRSINPIQVMGQVEGSAYMGLGEVMMEEQIFRRGLHKIPSLSLIHI